MKWIRIALAAGLLALVAGCSSSGGDIDVSLGEWVVTPDPASASSGDITFKATNGGTETHEMVIMRAESAAALPTDADGAVDESAMPAADVIGEIEDIEAGASGEVTFDLEPGTYVIFCNITEEEADGTIESHFQNGMHAVFTVDE
jgi:uncharacterized cupredoxin-like copper-binding protein